MIEELIRIENGIFVNAGREYHFDIMLSKGEGIGIYVDNHRTSGTAFREIFSGKTRIESGRVFLCGERTGYSEIMRWIRENTMVIDRNRFQAKELTARDYVCAFDKNARRVRLHAEAERLFTKEADEVRQQMGILFDWDTPLTTLTMPDYYRLSAFKAWLSHAQVVVLDRITEILRQQDLRPFMDCIRDCFLGNKNWGSGTFLLDGLPVSCRDLRRMVGSRIAVQIAMPDRTGGVLFDNLSALENLSTSLIPKAGKHFLHRHLMDSILDEASEWFDKDALLKPISTWSMPERLRLSYFKWYLMNPKVLICLFPFLGQESIYHEMIIDLLVLCARRGIAVWVISSGIHTIREKTRSREFLERVRFLD